MAPSSEVQLRAPKKRAPRILCCDATRPAEIPLSMSVAAIIVAAGSGVRAGGEIPKQYKPLLGLPVLAWSVRAFADAGVSPIVVAVAPEHGDLCRAATKDGPEIKIVPGGATRTDSVRAALAALGE